MPKLVPTKMTATIEAMMHQIVVTMYKEFLPQLNLLDWVLHEETEEDAVYIGHFWGETYFLVINLLGIKVLGRDEDHVIFLTWVAEAEPKWRDLQEAVTLWQNFRSQYWEV